MIEILSGGRGIGKTQKTLEFVVKKYNEAKAENKRLKEAIKKAREEIDGMSKYTSVIGVAHYKQLNRDDVLEIMDKLIESEE